MKRQFRKALVTGGAGFIGSHLVEALIGDRCEVHVIDNLSSGKMGNLDAVMNAVTFHSGDIRDMDLLLKVMKDCEVVFHQAAMVSVPQTVEAPVLSAQINDLGTLQVLEAARLNRVRRVVLASSSAVYGDDPRTPKTEVLPPAPKSPYAVQKLTGEFYARLYHDLYDLETVALRYFNVYGPRQDPSSPYSGVISIFVTRAMQNQPPIIYGDGMQSRDFIFVKDVVKANLAAASLPGVSGEVFNIGVGSAITINELWQIVSEAMAFRATPVYGPARMGDIRESVAGIEKARAVLNFKPDYSFKNGLDITLDGYRRG